MSIFDFFKKAENRQAWQNAPQEDLALRALPLLQFSFAALEAATELLVSPGSEPSKQFTAELDEICQKLASKLPSPESIDENREKLLASASSTASWQRGEVDGFRKDLIEATSSLITCIKNSMGDQDNLIGDFDKYNTEVGGLSDCSDLSVIRTKLKEHHHEAHKVLQHHLTKRKENRDVFLSVISDLETQVSNCEKTGSLDYLTGLANRAAFEIQLQTHCRRAQLDGSEFSVAIFDLDDFKGINDSHGHEAGDKALRKVAQVAREVFSDDAIVSRYGGDEFTVLGSFSTLTLGPLCRKVIDRIHSEPLSFEGEDGTVLIQIRLSFGIADHYESEAHDKLMRRADGALYEAKRAGKGVIRKAAAPSKRAA